VRPTREETRHRLFEAAAAMFTEQGIGATSVESIASAAGFTRGAFYSNFASKDDLVLAIADRLNEESAAGYTPSDCWVETLAEGMRRTRATYLAHPAAASLSAYRITQGPAEMQMIDIFVGAARAAGFEGAEAALVYRALADFCLYWAGCEASCLALDERLQKKDRDAWTSAYLAVDRADYPNIWQIRTDLPEVDDDDIFETVLSFVVAGLVARAPRPCGCARHAGRG